ncbi:MAG: hypothetical protein HC871_02560 [Rhizobiales bacterium]|nr:hypothetical protein [Hyphomicrobiales bacterium]
MASDSCRRSGVDWAEIDRVIEQHDEERRHQAGQGRDQPDDSEQHELMAKSRDDVSKPAVGLPRSLLVATCRALEHQGATTSWPRRRAGDRLAARQVVDREQFVPPVENQAWRVVRANEETRQEAAVQIRHAGAQGAGPVINGGENVAQVGQIDVAGAVG